MKSLLIFGVLLFTWQTTFSQVSGKFTGSDGKPAVSANVTLIKSTDSSVIKAAVTDTTGRYLMNNILPGTYFIKTSSIGFQTWYSRAFTIGSIQNTVDFGMQVLIEDELALGTVTVQARKPLFRQQAYGITVNVEGNLLTKGSSVLQVLERSPGVLIDYRNGDIALNGKSGVMIMLNGKLIRMPISQVTAMLAGIGADDISTIELLTTPPPGYDAEGNAGLINIVLKKTHKQGNSGSYSITGGYGKGEKGAANINFTHSARKIVLNGSYTFSLNRTYSDMNIASSQNMPLLGGALNAFLLDTTHSLQDNHDLNLGLEFKPDSSLSITASLNYYKSKSSSSNHTLGRYRSLNDSLLLFDGSVRGENRWNNLLTSIDVEKQIRRGEKFHSGIDFLYYNNDNPTDIQNQFVNKTGQQAAINNDTLFSPRQKGLALTTIKVGVLTFGYERQLSQHVKLETGIKATYTTSASVSGIESLVNNVWTSRGETSNNILMKEGVGALYASFTTKLNASTTVISGVRYEYAHTQLQNSNTNETSMNRKSGIFFPSLFFTKKLVNEAELQLSYTRRISRPSYNDLASYVTYSDPTAVYTGNPLLLPTITHNLKLGYNHPGYSISLLFSRDDHPIARYQITQKDAADLLYIAPQNLSWQNNITLQTSIPLQINEWWTGDIEFTGGLKKFRVVHTLLPVDKTYFDYSFNFSQSFTLPKHYRLELSGWYNSLSIMAPLK